MGAMSWRLFRGAGLTSLAAREPAAGLRLPCSAVATRVGKNLLGYPVSIELGMKDAGMDDKPEFSAADRAVARAAGKIEQAMVEF